MTPLWGPGGSGFTGALWVIPRWFKAVKETKDILMHRRLSPLRWRSLLLNTVAATWLICSCPEVGGESYSPPCVHMQINYYRDYAEDIQLITRVVFLWYWKLQVSSGDGSFHLGWHHQSSILSPKWEDAVVAILKVSTESRWWTYVSLDHTKKIVNVETDAALKLINSNLSVCNTPASLRLHLVTHLKHHITRQTTWDHCEREDPVQQVV